MPVFGFCKAYRPMYGNVSSFEWTADCPYDIRENLLEEGDAVLIQGENPINPIINEAIGCRAEVVAIDPTVHVILGCVVEGPAQGARIMITSENIAEVYKAV